MTDHLKDFILSMLAYTAQRDLDTEKLARLSNINPDLLQSENTVPLTRKHLDDLWLNAVLLSKDNLFGLHFGESLQLAALGVVGQIIKSSKDVDEALKIAASLTPLLTDLFTIKVERNDAVFMVTFVPADQNWKNNPVAIQTLNLLMVFVIHELDGLVLKKIIPNQVLYEGDIDDRSEFERVLRCQPEAANITMLTFDAVYWNIPIITANYELQQLLLDKTASVRAQVMGKSSLKERILNYLMANSYLGMVSLEQVASNFNVGIRTLQRKLKEENINFQQLADEVRKSLALEYIHSGTYPLKEISYMLGYNELSAFSRTFKRWTGTTPAYYRQAAVK